MQHRLVNHLSIVSIIVLHAAPPDGARNAAADRMPDHRVGAAGTTTTDGEGDHMKRHRNVKRWGLAVLAGMVLSCSAVVRADTVQEWNVTGTVGLTNQAGTAHETVNFSFDITYKEFLNPLPGTGGYYEAEYSHLQAVGKGQLGSFSRSFWGPDPVANAGQAQDGNFIPFADCAGGCSSNDDVFNIHLLEGLVSSPIAPVLGGADLYNCVSALCIAHFDIPGGMFIPATLSGHVTPVTTPEPGTLLLLLAGAALTSFFFSNSRCKSTTFRYAKGL